MVKTPKSKKHKRLTLHIVVDTNFLYTEAEDKLVCKELSDLITEVKSNDINIVWHLPATVEAERKYQMIKKAKTLLPKVAQLERLLGHKLGINEEILEDRVISVIKKQIAHYQLEPLPLDVSVVNWEWIISRAELRLPPFDIEKEKGFRDSLILESFFQLAERHPKTPSVCRLVLVSKDGLLADAFEERMGERTNIKLVSDLDEVTSYINILGSKITESLINDVLPRAQKLFFEVDNKDTMYFKDDVQQKIRNAYNHLIVSPPSEGFGKVVNPKILVSSPTFLSKTAQRICWSTKITFKLEASRKVEVSSQSLLTNALLGLNSLSSENKTQESKPRMNFNELLTNSNSLPLEEKKLGSSIFEVIWECTLTTKNKLINPKITEIKPHKTSWAE